jgi:hypothetical protein
MSLERLTEALRAFRGRPLEKWELRAVQQLAPQVDRALVARAEGRRVGFVPSQLAWAVEHSAKELGSMVASQLPPEPHEALYIKGHTSADQSWMVTGKRGRPRLADTPLRVKRRLYAERWRAARKAKGR